METQLPSIEKLRATHVAMREELMKQVERHDMLIEHCDTIIAAHRTMQNHIPDVGKMIDPTIVIAEMVDENNLHSYLHANKPI